MTNHHLPPPVLRLALKDHKQISADQETLPCRPIAAAALSHNGQASSLVSSLLNAVADLSNSGTECRSTEDMIAKIEEKVNSREETDSLVPGSMDVDALYPSLLAGPTADIVAEAIKDSELKMEGVDWEEAGKYLSLNSNFNLSPEMSIYRCSIVQSNQCSL